MDDMDSLCNVRKDQTDDVAKNNLFVFDGITDIGGDLQYVM